MRHFYCDLLFTGHEWLAGVHLETDDHGNISAVRSGSEPGGATKLPGVVIPGVPNLHSHAHQRAMAGLAERAGGDGQDSFWTWRHLMYRHLAAMTPEDLEAIAAQLYVEMLEAGYTAVGEFQYLHHQPSGAPYDEPAEMTLRCLSAALEVGIGFTALPVFYAHGGFGSQPTANDQRRFICHRDLYGEILDSVRQTVTAIPAKASFGVAPHSLRAVDEEELRWLVELEPDRPIHLHIAEQVKEVEDCVAWSGSRPMAFLLDRFKVDSRWCLIHGTHLDDEELNRAAQSGAVMGLCPVTEANLGDGIFRAVDYLKRAGIFGIGSDSHISVSPVEELRWLEYGQRLRHLGRNLVATNPGASSGQSLLQGALRGGAQACDRRLGALAVGYRADWLVLDHEHPLLVARSRSEILDSWIFSGNSPLIREAYVGAQRVVADGRHLKRDAVATRFRSAIERLRSRA